MPRDALVRRRFIIRGMVQGVGFRYWTRATARRLALRGYVRNTADGGVEVVAEGEREAVDGFAALLAGDAAPGRVTNTEVNEEKVKAGEFSAFDIAF